MAGILQNYLIGTKLSWVARFCAFAMMAAFAMFARHDNVMFLLVIAPMGLLVLIDFNTRLHRFYRIMPIKPWIIVLVNFFHNFLAIFIGVAVAVTVVLVSSTDTALGLGVILFGAAVQLSAQASILSVFYAMTYRWYLIIFVPILGPLALMYLVFGYDAMHQIIRNNELEYLRHANIFTDMQGMIAFALASLGLYIAAYFPALALYKKSDHFDIKWWM